MTEMQNDTVEDKSSETSIRCIPASLFYAYRNDPHTQIRPAFENEAFLVLKGIIHPRPPALEQQPDRPRRNSW